MSFPWEGRHDFAKDVPLRKSKKIVAQPIQWDGIRIDVNEPIKTVKRPQAASGRALASQNSDIKVINLVTGEVTVTKNKVTAPRNKKGSR